MNCQTETKYQIVQLDNGKFAPRIVSQFGSCWFEHPYEYESFEDAVEVLRKKKLENEKVLSKEVVVFTL